MSSFHVNMEVVTITTWCRRSQVSLKKIEAKGHDGSSALIFMLEKYCIPIIGIWLFVIQIMSE